MVVTASLPFILRSAFIRCMRQPFSSSSNLAVEYFDTDYKARISARRYELLLDSVNREESNPSRAWENYVNALDSLGVEHLPLEIHQKVLRRCVPSIQQLRSAAERRVEARKYPQAPHRYESRLQAIIRNMRAAGYKPALNDYNFILGQFAAVGHHTGAMHILQEMNHLGVTPDSKTYGLSLQCIAHRLTLPCREDRREALARECAELCVRILKNMSARNIPFTSANLDLALRIWKDTANKEAFDRILKFGYGVDLEYPDQLPLETGLDDTTDDTRKPLVFQPFSTHTLNTTIDYLGKEGKISKMVQAFEVLTTPLIKPSPQEPSPIDDDEEDDFLYPPSNPPLEQLPHADFNTTTFNVLIRHLARARHTVLARHYALQAIRHDISISNQLQQDLDTKSLADISRPRVAVNRGTLLPILGLGNRDGDLSVLRWVLDQIRVVKKHKKHNLAFMEEFWTRMNRQPIQAQEDDAAQEDTQPVKEKTIENEVDPLDLDLDSPAKSHTPKFLDLPTHIFILQRDLRELKEFEEQVKDAFARIHERVKEKLGRRVWRRQDIFLADQNKRTTVSKERWKETVRFLEIRQSRRKRHLEIGSERTFDPASPQVIT